MDRDDLGWVADDSFIQPQNQLGMAKGLLSADLFATVERHVRKHGDTKWCLFHRRQLWFIMQASLIASDEDAPEAPEDALRHAVGECCLMASDILQQLETNEQPGEGPEEANRWITGLAIPIMNGRDRLEVLARAYSFWFALPALPDIQARFAAQGVPDFGTAFADKYGMPLREFFLILFTLHLGFQAHALKSKNPLLLEEASYLRPVFGDENVRRAVSVVSQTPDTLALSLFSTARQSWATDFTPLREHPVIEVFPGKHACLDHDLLHRCLTDRVYFMLQKAYSAKAFSQLFGYVFEAYINRLLGSFTYEGDTLVRTFYASPKFKGKQDEAGDGIIVWDRSVLVMEYKARLLTTREKYGGITEVLLTGVEDILGKEKDKKGVFQLAKVIARLLTGEEVVADSQRALTLKNHPQIHPVLVTYEEAVGLESIRQEAETRFFKALRVDDAKRKQVGRLLILTIAEVEILDGLALKHSIEEVVRDYAEYVAANPKDRVGSFRSFVCNSRYNYDPPRLIDTMVGKCYQRAMEDIGPELERRHPGAGAGAEPVQARELPATFHRLAAAWKEEKQFTSSMTTIEESPHYRAIIDMGEAAVPLLLQELERDPDFWFTALQAITGEDPVPPKDRGDLLRMTEHWLTWGRRSRRAS